MNPHYDALETRSAEEREAALMAALPRQVAYAKSRAPGFAGILENSIRQPSIPGGRWPRCR